jgi:cyanophycin synthetase
MAKTATSTRAPAKAKAKPAPKANERKAAPVKAARPAKKVAAPQVPSLPSEGAWSFPLPPFVLQGFAFGLPYPAAVVHCAVPETTPAQRADFARRFEALLAGAKGMHRLDAFVDPAAGSGRPDTARWFRALAERLQLLANLPVYAESKVIGSGQRMITFLIPALSRGVQPTVELLKLACTAFASDDEGAIEMLRPQVHAAFATLKASALTTSNTPRLAKAAVANDIPFQELPGNLVLYGVGRNSVLMDSTFTHECSNIGARLAKYKHLTTAYLRRAGLPAPANGIATSEDHAVQIAEHLGYPVVVKPADKDGGIAVQADLRTADEVRWAYEGARKVSSQVLVEKFYQGRDYRIVVFRGKAIWAKERQPAGVTGNGKASIRALVEAINADPRRGSDVYAALKKIKLDDEAETLLARDGLTFDSVPKKGTFVPLRRRANISAGGVPIAVTDVMHPDNARVAERAAELVGLDLAGVDLIIPDIATSWRDVPAAICEVNAQPELGGDAEHLYPQVLKALVRNTGHVPTIAVFGGSRADQVTTALVKALSARGVCVGSHDRTGVYVGGETVLPGDMQVLRSGRMLTLDRRVEVIVLGSLDVSVLRQGLPVQRIDTLVLTGDAPAVPEQAQGQGDRLLVDTLRLIAPHCRTAVALGAAQAFDPAVLAAVNQAVKLNHVVPANKFAAFMDDLVTRVVGAARASAGDKSGSAG